MLVCVQIKKAAPFRAQLFNVGLESLQLGNDLLNGLRSFYTDELTALPAQVGRSECSTRRPLSGTRATGLSAITMRSSADRWAACSTAGRTADAARARPALTPPFGCPLSTNCTCLKSLISTLSFPLAFVHYFKLSDFQIETSSFFVRCFGCSKVDVGIKSVINSPCDWFNWSNHSGII